MLVEEFTLYPPGNSGQDFLLMLEDEQDLSLGVCYNPETSIYTCHNTLNMSHILHIH